MSKTKIIIMGAAGRDFHNFNVVFRDDPRYEVVAFTATQIPGIEGRVYPPTLAGALYPQGIPIHPEVELTSLIRARSVDRVVFAYSDVAHTHVMHKASEALAVGADFWLLGPRRTQLRASVPVVAVCAVRTGSGKSQTSRQVTQLLRAAGQRVVAVRHPMPYGDLTAQAVQRFATYDDLDRQRCTVEEREEFEPFIEQGAVVYAGVDYGRILQQAQAEADVIVWDGGNNDLPFYAPDLHIVVADPLRAGHELAYHPGEANFRAASVIVINKENVATSEQIAAVRASARQVNPTAMVIDAASTLSVDAPDLLRGRRVAVVEDGPTLTHGEMTFGAGVVAARQGGAEIVSPVPYAVGSLREVYARYPKVSEALPAMGYDAAQVAELEATLNAMPVDAVVIGTPIDLRRILHLTKPSVRVRYELEELGEPRLETILQSLIPVAAEASRG